MKKCPYCAEEIQDEAIVCRYCGRDLVQPSKLNKPVIPPKKPNFRNDTKVGRTIVFLLGLCVFMACIIPIMRSFTTASPAQKPTATETAKLSSIEYRTFTSVPTITSTPKLTRTPRPTRTPEPTVNPYMLAAQQKFINFRNAFLDVNKFARMAATDPSVVFDQEWKTNTGLALGVLNFRADELANLEPSLGFEKYQSYMIELAKETHLFTDLYAKGTDNLDADSINAATEHLKNITQIMLDATVELDNVKNSQ